MIAIDMTESPKRVELLCVRGLYQHIWKLEHRFLTGLCPFFSLCEHLITLVHSDGSEIGNVVLKLRSVPNSLSNHLVREAHFTKMGKVEFKT